MTFLSRCRHCWSEQGCLAATPKPSRACPLIHLCIFFHFPWSRFLLLVHSFPLPFKQPISVFLSSLVPLLISVPELSPWEHPLGSRIILQHLQELSAGSCSASCCSLARDTTGQGGTSGLLCLGVGLPVLGSEEGLERLCRTDRMGFGACEENLRDLGCRTC